MIPFEVHQRKAGLEQDVKKNEPETIAKITKNKPKIRFIIFIKKCDGILSRITN